LTGLFDGPVQLPLIVSGQTRVFARQDAPGVGHELPEQGHVFVFERINRKIDFRLGPGSSDLRGTASSLSVAAAFIGMSVPWHNGLLDFAVQRMAAQERVVFLKFYLLRLKLLVSSRGIARG